MPYKTDWKIFHKFNMKLIPKKHKWQKLCQGLHGGFIDGLRIMEVSQVQVGNTSDWYYIFTSLTYLRDIPRERIARTLFRKFTTAKKAAEKEYTKSFKLMVEHVSKISDK